MRSPWEPTHCRARRVCARAPASPAVEMPAGAAPAPWPASTPAAGNLDRPAGAAFPQAATDRTPRPAGPSHGFTLGRWHSRVSGHPEAKGELPLSALAEEIDTATGEGEPIRALITSAANPVLSAPDGDRLDKALDSLDFMVSIDPYLNETTRHATVVLPPPPPSPSPHHD